MKLASILLAFTLMILPVTGHAAKAKHISSLTFIDLLSQQEKQKANNLFPKPIPSAFAIFQAANNAVGVDNFALPIGSVLHYMAPTGNDACNGTSPAIGTSGNCAWLTPNHNMNGGEVIIAAAGTYTGGFQSHGTVSNVPSTTGGIDGAGGIYFVIVLCGASDITGCVASTPSGGNPTIQVGVGNGQANTPVPSNWLYSGWTITAGGTNHGFLAVGCGISNPMTVIVHHIALVNSIVYNSGSAAATGDCGNNHNVPGNGVDYFAAIGVIGQNAVLDPICIGAFDDAGPANFDSTAGPHTIFYGNFGLNNRVSCISDGEAFFFDTWDAHNRVGTGVMMNNIAAFSERMNYAVFYQGFNAGSTSTKIRIHHNTSFAADAGVNNNGSQGEFNFQGGGNCGSCSIPYDITVTKNISMTNWASPGGGSSANGFIYSLLTGGGVNTNTVIGGTGTENIFLGLATPNCAGTCDSGKNVIAFNGASFGTNTYSNPLYTNTTDLANNQLGVPSCAGKETTTDCMGYNVLSATLRTPSVISDLQANCAGCADKGYQLPSTNCVSSGDIFNDFPTWMKGVLRLKWNPGNLSVTRVRDLVTIKCGL